MAYLGNLDVKDGTLIVKDNGVPTGYVQDKLVLYLDISEAQSFRGVDYNLYDLSGKNRTHSIDNVTGSTTSTFVGNPPRLYISDEPTTQGFSHTGALTLTKTATVVIVAATSKTQQIMLQGQTGNNWLFGYNNGAYTDRNVGTPSYYVDKVELTNPSFYIDGNLHMFEAKNVNFLDADSDSPWTSFNWFKYSGSWKFAGMAGAIMIYDKVLSADESLQNYNYFKTKFNLT